MSKTYPIAEIFTSPQGEGTHTGSLLTFIRFAGCSVGKPFTPDERAQVSLAGTPLKMYQEKCTAWNGVSFACDTNYRKAEALTAEEILSRVTAPGICITGGEPLLHDLRPLIQKMDAEREPLLGIHVETSGTIAIPEWLSVCSWVCVSPKKGYRHDSLLAADELKVLVGPEFDEKLFIGEFEPYLDKTFLQPINDEHHINFDNLKRCLDLQVKYTQVRISTQMHKIWNVR